MFSATKMAERVSIFCRNGHATGPGVSAPTWMSQRRCFCVGWAGPLALGVFCPEGSAVDPEALRATLERGLARCGLVDEPARPFAAHRPPVMAL